MTLEDLRIFTVAVEARSLGQAARDLDLSQPAVAQHVRRLERELGTALLDRTPRGVDLTLPGRAFYDRVSAALAALGDGVREVANLRDRGEGSVTLSASSGAVRHYLKPALTTLRRKRPGIELRLVCANTRAEQIDAVRKRRAELAFMTLTDDIPGFEQRTVAEMPYMLVVHRDDPLAKQSRVHVRRLAEIRYIAVGDESVAARHVAATLSEQGMRMEVAETVDTEGTAILWTELGMGQVLLPKIQAAALARRGELRALPIRGLPPIGVGWAARDFSLLTSSTRELVDLVDRASGQWTGSSR